MYMLKPQKTTRDSIVKKLSSNDIFTEEVLEITAYTRTTAGVKAVVSSDMLSRVMKYLRAKIKGKKTVINEAAKEADPIDTSSCLPDEALETLIDDENRSIFIAHSNSGLNTESIEFEEREVFTNDDENEPVTADQQNMKIENPKLETIYKKMQNHSKTPISVKWQKKTVTEFKTLLNDFTKIMKLQHDEMNLILEETHEQQNALGMKLKKATNKDEKARFIWKIVWGKSIDKEKMTKKMMPLRDFAMNVVKTSTSKIPKERLNKVTAAVLFRERNDKWTEASNFGEGAEIDKVGTTSWFSYPEFDETRQKMEPKCIDAHHLLVNLRSKVCKDGVSGIRKEAWHKVAESNSAIISKGIVVDLLDKQNNAFAKKTFSLAVENEMRSLNYLEEAKFCRLVGRWFDAEDSAGHSATERIRMKLDLKEYLLKDVEFGIFPPPGMYIKGFPKIMFEGFLQRIDTSIQLYSIINSRSYNHRSISSLVNETFFWELSEYEPTKLGCPKAVTIPRLMSNVTEMQHFRCDPSERAFHICTTKRSVYPTRKLLPSAENLDTDINENTSDKGEKGKILPRNHEFDAPELLGKRQRISKQSDISKPHEVSRGCLPIRQHHKCDETKMLATTRMGIPLDNIENK